MLQTIFQTTLEISLTMSALILFLLLAGRWMKKRYSSRWRYFVWLVIAVRLVVPWNPQMENPLVRLSLPKEYHVQLSAEGGLDLPGTDIPADESGEILNSTAAPAAAKPEKLVNGNTYSELSTKLIERPSQKETVSGAELPLVGIAAGLWLLGAIGIGGFYAVRYVRFCCGLRRWRRPEQDAAVREILDTISARYRIKRLVRVERCVLVHSPMVVGFWNPVILLPELPYATEELEAIFSHELVHWKRLDVWYKLLLLTASIWHWFNPLVWMMLREAERDIEFSCDAAVVRGADVHSRKRYSQAILSSLRRELTVEHGQKLWQSNIFVNALDDGKRTMKERFTNIFDMRKRRRGVAALLSILLIASVAGSFVACGNEVKQTNKELNIFIYSADLKDALSYPLMNFRQKYPDVQVNINDVPQWDGNAETYHERIQTVYSQLRDDLRMGQGPDLVIVNPAILQDIYKTMGSGAFADLNPMLEQDESYDPTLYNQVVLDAGVYQGKRFTMPLFYSIKTLVARRDTLDQVGFDLEKANTYDGLMEEALRCVENDENRIPFYSETPFAEDYLRVCGLSLLNYDDKSVAIDTSEMKKMQEIVKEYVPYRERVQTGEFMDNRLIEETMEKQTIFYPSDPNLTYRLASQMMGDDIESVLLPVRTFDGKIQADITITSGIRNNSPNRENAYHFLRELMGDVFQMGGTYGMLAPALPILIRNTYDKIYQIKQSTLDGYDNGIDMRSIGEDYVTKPLSDETYDLLIQWVNDIGYASYYTKIENKISEYFTPYYKGEKTYEQCLAEAEAKLKIYMSE